MTKNDNINNLPSYHTKKLCKNAVATAASKNMWLWHWSRRSCQADKSYMGLSSWRCSQITFAWIRQHHPSSTFHAIIPIFIIITFAMIILYSKLINLIQTTLRIGYRQTSWICFVMTTPLLVYLDPCFSLALPSLRLLCRRWAIEWAESTLIW